MGILSDDMKRVIREQRLGFWATVCEDGSPNLSPKGSTHVWDDDHIFFADVRSPRTVANVRRGSAVEVNVVDPLARRGYRFKGPAQVVDPGSDDYAAGIRRLRESGSALVGRVNAFVVLEVRSVAPLISPAYDEGATEGGLVRRWSDHFAALHPE